MKKNRIAGLLLLSQMALAAHALAMVQGSAATPLAKKKVAVLGGGGYLGALTFGFLQRSASLHGTGIGAVRCIGATADTAVRMNRILSKHFCLAVADESFIKLTDLLDVDAIAQRLSGWDAIVLGSDLCFQTRSVTSGTYEKTPNDKAYDLCARFFDVEKSTDSLTFCSMNFYLFRWELYWDEPKGAFNDSGSPPNIKKDILRNVLAASKQAGVQHMVVVDDGSLDLDGVGVPYTRIRTPSTWTETPNYTFKRGIQGDLILSLGTEGEVAGSLCREDLAALCVQSLQSLRWDQSRTLSVSCTEPAKITVESGGKRKLRDDQHWCVNSSALEEKLARIT
jgi:hypothetical protein